MNTLSRRGALPLIILILGVLVIAGTIATIVFLQLLTPPLWDYFDQRNRTSLELATQLAIEECESGLDTLLRLRLSDEPSMVETIRKDALLRIGEIAENFTHLSLVIVNDRNELLIDPGPENVNPSMFFDLPRKMPERALAPSEEPGALMHWRYFPFFRWHLIAYRSSGDVQAPVKMARKVVVSSMLCTILVLLGTLLLVFNYYIQHPLKQVIKAAEGVPDGVMEPLPVLRNDELGRLTITFNTMINSLGEKQKLIQKSVEEMQKSLHEKEILLQEVHHRVRNNLNVIISLLNLRSQTLTTKEDAVQAFVESTNRIRSMAMIHGQLYETKDFANVRVDQFIGSLIGDLRLAYAVGEGIRIETALDDLTLDIVRSVPLGLIVNECLSNALRHAYGVDDTGTIRVFLKNAVGEGILELVIEDDGRGITEKHGKKRGLGMLLIHELSTQIGGTLEIDGSRGTRIILRIPL
jgi:two-component sensor histidine kinase